MTLAAALTSTVVWGKVALTVGLSLISESLQDAPARQEAQARKTLIRASDAPRRVIYGSARVSGNLMYAANGTDAGYVHVVIALAGHQCQAINDCYLGTERVGALDSGGDCIEGRFAGHVRIRKYLGTATQAMDTDLATECPEWGAKDRPGKGIAYVYLRIKRSRDVFPNGMPTPRFDVLGKNDILDPRTGAVGYTANAALCALDYIRWEHGFGSDLSEVDEAAWIAAANICDEDVSVVGGGTQKRYRINGTFTTDRRNVDVLADMRQAMAGGINYSMGIWTAWAGAASAPVMDISERDLRGPYRVRPRVAADAVYNAVKGRYTETAHWTETDFPPVTSSAFEAEDGGRRIYKDVLLPFETNVERAQRLARIDLLRHRQGIVVELAMRIKGLGLRPGNVVRLSLAKVSWVNKLFRVIRWDFNLFGGPDLVLEEYSDTIYTWSYLDATAVDPAPDTMLPNRFAGLTVGAIACASGSAQLLMGSDGTVISRLEASWAALPNPYISRYLVQYKAVDATTWDSVPPVTHDPGVTLHSLIGPLVDGTAYQVRVLAETTLGNRGNWTTSAEHTVVGKTAAPSNVTGFAAVVDVDRVTLTWDAVADADLAAYDIRTGTTWDGGTPLVSKGRGEVSHTFTRTAPGALTLRIKARDTSGNRSATEAVAALDVSAAPAPVLTVDSGTCPIVRLSWTAVAGSLPTTHYEVRRGGVTWDAATIVTTTTGRTATETLTAVGTYRYWVAAVSTGGLVGTPAALDMTVAMPPVPAGLAIENGTLSFNVRWPASSGRPDHLACWIHVSTSSSFTPTADNVSIIAHCDGGYGRVGVYDYRTAASGWRRTFYGNGTYYVRVGFTSTAIAGGTVIYSDALVARPRPSSGSARSNIGIKSA